MKLIYLSRGKLASRIEELFLDTQRLASYIARSTWILRFPSSDYVFLLFFFRIISFRSTLSSSWQCFLHFKRYNSVFELLCEMSPNKRLHDTARSPFYDCIAKHPRICFPSNDEPLIGVDVHLLLKHSGIPFSPEDIRETPKIQRWGDLVPHTRPPFWKKKRGRLSTR